MERFVNIALGGGRKAQIPAITYNAIRRAARTIACDKRAARYAAAPHEGITPEIVGAVRSSMMIRGQLNKESYMRNLKESETV